MDSVLLYQNNTGGDTFHCKGLTVSMLLWTLSYTYLVWKQAINNTLQANDSLEYFPASEPLWIIKTKMLQVSWGYKEAVVRKQEAVTGNRKTWSGNRRPWSDNMRPWSGNRRPWSGNRRPWSGNRGPWSGNRSPWSGSRCPWPGKGKPWSDVFCYWKQF